MNCPRCQTANPEGAKFCINCGNPLSISCTNCGTQLAIGAKFCINCGQPVAAAAAVVAPMPPAHAAPPAPPVDPALARLEQYIPKELLNKLERARANRSMEGERRIVTVLFCDVKGSTALAEQLDPEEWAEIMNGAFKYLIEPVYRYEGTLARLMGDAILAFFGAPIGHEDDPQRAVMAALDIVEGIKEYRQQIKRSYGFDLSLRVGINTGLVVVGEVGSDLRVEYTAMGDAVNLAARMEQTAEPGSVQITANTYKSISNLFEFESLGGIEVKGKSEPVEAYRVLARREGAVPTRGIEGLSSPLVGRSRELDTLRARMDDLMSGQGQIVSVMGEAGLGKSRLISELRKALVAEGLLIEAGGAREGLKTVPCIQWCEGRSLSYETTTPYAPFVDLFNSCFGLHADDGPYEKLQKVRANVSNVMPGQEEMIVPFLATLLGIELEGEDAERVRYLQPPQVRGRIFYTVQAYIGALASKLPTLLMFEDLHWADPTSLELLSQLVPLTESASLMILAVFRPNTQDASWQFHENAAREYAHRYTHVALEPLDDRDSRQLVSNLLEIEDLPEAVRALILKKAEGNPFFVEEVIRSLLDMKLVVREGDHWRATREIENIAVPDTLAGVITARLDRLDDDSKRVAQTAAVVGRDFAYDALEEVYEAPQVLGGAVSTLQRRELIREKSRIPRRAYLFKHVLTQETAYASLLLSKRRDLHKRVGEYLERVEPDRAGEIARHYLEARQEERALPHLVEAGDSAARADAREEARGYYRKAIDILQRIPDVKLARRVYEGLGKVLEFSMDVPGAIATYQEMLSYGEEHDDVSMKISALNKLSYANAFMMGQFAEADAQLAAAEELANRHQDLAGLAEMYTVKCGMCTAMADFSGANKYLTEAAALGKKLDMKDQTAYGLAHKANTLVYMTQFEDAWVTAQEGLQVSNESGNRERKAEILSTSLPFVYLHRGELDLAYMSAEQGYKIGTQIGAMFSPVFASYMLGTVALMQGEYEDAIQWQERGLQGAQMLMSTMPFMAVLPMGSLGTICLGISDKLKERTVQYHTQALEILQTPVGGMSAANGYVDLGFCALELGYADLAADYFERGLNQPSVSMYLMRPLLLAGSGLAALARNDPDEAASRVIMARAYAHEHEMMHFYPHVEWIAGQITAARGNHEAALEQFNRAEELALDMRMRPIVWQARAGAAHALSLLGRESEAADKRQQAAEMIDEIAALFQDQDYRTLFLESAHKKLQATVGEAVA
ncbi:MAG TPA: BREX system ATP-binding domain-containing protein [Chloroflexia bacterium]